MPIEDIIKPKAPHEANPKCLRSLYSKPKKVIKEKVEKFVNQRPRTNTPYVMGMPVDLDNKKMYNILKGIAEKMVRLLTRPEREFVQEQFNGINK